MEDTIIGLATLVGQSSVAIIRVSGPDSIKIVNKIFTKNLNKLATNTINYGYILNNDETIDEVLVSIFKAPKSYTTEDVVEINCHGGLTSVKKITELLLSLGGRMAEPGEFTKRAFLNGRISLNEAEAVMELIKSESDRAAALALSAMKGSLTTEIKSIKDHLINIISFLEVSVDYPEYDIDDQRFKDIEQELDDILFNLKNLLDTKLITDPLINGIKIAIIGKPNVGKSSLLNKIMDEQKAIVSEYEGTTRDLVEGNIFLNGIKIKLIDTAGLRETEDVVERIGIGKAKEQLIDADLVLYVIDSNQNVSNEDLLIINKIKEKTIIVNNKVDINNKQSKIDLPDYKVINTSALTNHGINELKKQIINFLNLNNINENQEYYLNERQYLLIKESVDILMPIANNYSNFPVDLQLVDFRIVCEKLSEITGEVFYEDLINEIFSNFCLGK